MTERTGLAVARGSRRPVSLTSRLVLTVVALVIGTSLVTSTATAFAVSRYLTVRLDGEVLAALDRARLGPAPGQEGQDGSGETAPDAPDIDDTRGQAVGTLTAIFPAEPQSAGQRGDVIVQADDGPADRVDLSEEDLATLAALPPDGEPRDVDLTDRGQYRVAAVDDDDGRFVTGLPTDDLEEVVRTLVLLELGLLAIGASAAIATGVVLVRRQLRPLREVAATAHDVAELPLATDAVDLGDRVPAHLRDERTEVGQVGVALAGLLAHVGTSLEARRRSEEQVRRFVADASHELRTPLTTIGGYVQLARRLPDDREATETALTKVEEESARMTALVEDLLLLARLDAGRPLERGTVDVTHLLLEAVADARVVADDHRWHLELPEEGIEVPGDASRLHQVVTNLLTNARKYTPSGTTVTAGAAATQQSVVITVHDDGPGFDQDAAAHAFERFARGDPARQRAGGAGLGLALVEAIVAAHGGTVGLESRPGSTTLSVVLPSLRV